MGLKCETRGTGKERERICNLIIQFGKLMYLDKLRIYNVDYGPVVATEENGSVLKLLVPYGKCH